MLEQCPEEDEVILMSTMMVSVLVWAMVMIVTMAKVMMVIMSHDVVSYKSIHLIEERFLLYLLNQAGIICEVFA